MIEIILTYLNLFLVVAEFPTKVSVLPFFMGITIGFVLYFIVINLDLNLQSTIKKYGKPSAISKWKPLELNSIESILNQTTDPRSNDLLFEQVRIVCIVMDDSFNKLRAEEIQMTWGQRCNKLVFTNTENGILLYFLF